MAFIFFYFAQFSCHLFHYFTDCMLFNMETALKQHTLNVLWDPALKQHTLNVYGILSFIDRFILCVGKIT